MHAFIYTMKKMHQMQNHDRSNKHANMTTSTKKKNIFLENKPKMKNKTLEIK